MPLRDSLVFVFFFYNLLRYYITQIRISKQWKFQSVLFFTGMKRSRKRKCEIHKVFNLTRLALYDATITKMPITNTTCTRGTHYLFRCKELYINKKDFPLMNVFLTFDSVTMRRLNLSKMQREARFQNSEYAFHRPPHPSSPFVIENSSRNS